MRAHQSKREPQPPRYTILPKRERLLSVVGGNASSCPFCVIRDHTIEPPGRWLPFPICPLSDAHYSKAVIYRVKRGITRGVIRPDAARARDRQRRSARARRRPPKLARRGR